MHYLINDSLEKGDMLLNYASWCGLEAYLRGLTVTLFLVKMGKNLESICIEDQDLLFTYDLIFLESMFHTKGFCI